MKRTFALLALVLFVAFSASAQMDDKFYFPSKNMAPLGDLKFEEVSLPADTAQLTGIFLKPTKKPKATILFFHGAGGNVTSYTFMTRPLVEVGYQVMMIDFRGYGKSTGTPTHLNIAKDGQAVLNYLLQRKDVKGTKVILYGASMGSQIAVKLAKENESKIAALVLDGTISSFTDIALHHAPAEHHPMIKQLPSPYAAKDDIKAVRKIPVLFIHSKEDREVPYTHTETVYNNAGGKKTLLVYEGKHLEAMKSDAPKVINAINQLVTEKESAPPKTAQKQLGYRRVN